MSTDRELVCSDCGSAFTFTVTEQERYAERGFDEPKRCPGCRAARRAKRKRMEARQHSSFRSSRPRKPRRPRTFRTITCAACGKEAEVPFEPAPGRPVYCPQCYRSMRGDRNDSYSEDSGGRNQEWIPENG